MTEKMTEKAIFEKAKKAQQRINEKFWSEKETKLLLKMMNLGITSPIAVIESGAFPNKSRRNITNKMGDLKRQKGVV